MLAYVRAVYAGKQGWEQSASSYRNLARPYNTSIEYIP